MQTLAEIEAKRAKRLAAFGVKHTLSQKRKFVKAILDDIAGLRVEIEDHKGRNK